MQDFQTGFMLRREIPPEGIKAAAKQIEDAGFDECWLVEDCFYYSGIASTTLALAETSRIKIGLGIMPAVARNPAFTAMEIATLARIYPGRLLPALGHGVAEWMKQIGAFPASQLAALEETTTIVRRLLRGETVTFEGRQVNMDKVLLEFPPAEVPPIYLGVRGPKSMQLSGRSSDGTIIAEFSAPAYISESISQIKLGQEQAGRSSEDHKVTLYALTVMDTPDAKAVDILRPIIAERLMSGSADAHLHSLPFASQIDELISHGQQFVEQNLPDEWIRQLTIAGSPDECAQTVEQLVNAGADSVVFVPVDGNETETLNSVRDQLLPLVSNKN